MSAEERPTASERDKLGLLRRKFSSGVPPASKLSPSPSPLPTGWKYGQMILVGVALTILTVIIYAYWEITMDFLSPLR